MKNDFNVSTAAILLCCLSPGAIWAEEMEPRRWTHLPTGSNFIGAAAVHTRGDIVVDPVLRIEDGEIEADTIISSYLHSFDLLGKSARLDVRLPCQRVRLGLLNGELRRVEREGMGDPFIRLSVNFLGAPGA